MASLANRSVEHNGQDAGVFNGVRWMGRDKPAVKTGPGYLAFGLGRWACPGRFLAIAEIKLLVFTLLARMEAELVGGQYTVVDKLNATSVPPEAKFLLKVRGKFSE